MNSKLLSKAESSLTRESKNYSLVIYKGRSMNPTLMEPELMEVVSIGFNSIRIGDVILYHHPYDAQKNVVHRVVDIQVRALKTRGDNNTRNDPYVVTADHVIGMVVASWRKDVRRVVRGGWMGRASATLWLFRALAIKIASQLFLSRAYRLLSSWMSPMAIYLLPTTFQPRVIHYPEQSQWRYQIFIANRRIGRFDVTTGQWEIRRPYRLIVDVEKLPRSQ